MKKKVILDFIEYPIAQKISFGRLISANLKKNQNTFQTPDVPINEIDQRSTYLESCYLASQNNGDLERINETKALIDWDNAMRKVARYVDRIADGNEMIIALSGFSASKDRTETSKPIFSVETGEQKGTLIVHRQTIEGAKTYLWQISYDNAIWTQHAVTTTANVTLTGLQSEKRCYVRVAAVTAHGTTDFCTPIGKMVE